MSTITQKPELAPRLRGLLRGLRWRIRAYTLLQGVCLIVCWLVIMFWFALLCDYGPVWMGASEMPLAARAVLLAIAGIGTLYIGYRWIARRTFASMADHSMAVLLERQHKDFHDSLLTSVEMNERPDHAADFNQEMLAHAGDEAISRAGDVRLRRVFRWRPLWLPLAAAVLLSASVALFAAAPGSRDTFKTAASRIVLLDDHPWKRMALLEVEGITRWTYEYEAPTEDEADSNTSSLKNDRPKLVTVAIPFDDDHRVQVARGSSPRLTIKADIHEHTRPDDVTLYWSSGNKSDRATMTEGDTRDGWLEFMFADSPLKGISATVEFHALGYDFRTPLHHIEMVEPPTILDVQLIHERPDYLVDEKRSAFKRIEEPLIAGTQVPRGSRVTFQATSNKPLQTVYVYNIETKQTEVLKITGDKKSRKTISYTIDNLEHPIALEWMLIDDDALVNESPHAVAIGVREDEPPKVNIALRGVGSAITPDATFPVFGRITDDYWLQRAWLEVERGEMKRRLPLPFKQAGFDEEEIADWKIGAEDNVYHRVDFRDERNRDDDPLTLQPGDKITISARAADLYDLDGYNVKDNPHAGSGDRYQLDVVTPDQLLSLLERRELELRRRLEQIVEELTQMRDSLVRVQNDLSADEPTNDGEATAEDRAVTDAAEPGDKPLTAEEKAHRSEALRRLRVQRAVNQSEKSRGETEGVGRAMLDIVAQLENNRVDTEDRQDRLSNQVAAPLLSLVTDGFVELDTRLAGLNIGVNKTGDVDRPKAALASEHAIAQTDEVLLKLDEVLQKMVDMESFTELLDKIRDIIEEQDELVDETKTLRKKQIFGLE